MLVWKSKAVSLLLAIVCIALSYFSVIFSQSSASGRVTWNCSGRAAVLLSSRSRCVRESSAREQRAFLAGCRGLGLCSEGRVRSAPRSRSARPRVRSHGHPGLGRREAAPLGTAAPCARAAWDTAARSCYRKNVFCYLVQQACGHLPRNLGW